MKGKMKVLVAVLAISAAVFLVRAYRDSDAAGRDRGPGRGGPGMMAFPLAGVTVDDLDDRLGLSDAQRDQMERALDALRDARDEMREEKGDAPFRGPHGGVEEPPMIAFVEEMSKTLTPDQFKELAQFASEKRDAFVGERRGRGFGPMSDRGGRGSGGGPGAGGPGIGHRGRSDERRGFDREDRRERMEEMVEWRLENMKDHLERRAAFLERVLGLDGAQAAEVRGLVLGTMDERAKILGDLREGDAEPRDVAEKLAKTEKRTADKIEDLLNSDQRERWDALRDLMPRPW